MDKYYYLVAQLPVLFFERESALTIDNFLDEAHKWLSGSDYRQLERVDFMATEIKPDDPQIIKKIKVFELSLRQELVNWRTARQKSQDYKIMALPANLVREGNPLVVEKNLLLWRWQFLEVLEAGHNFDLDFVILYYLRLQILKKLFTYNKKLGREKYQQYLEMGL
ncbi:MAG: DUF2764 family protein [Candidatus Neomarinimicrobiota bacterium]